MDPLIENPYQFYLDDPAFSQLDFANLPDFSQVLSDPFQLGIHSEPPAKRRTRMRAPKACLACRSRHMKCDSVEPKCTRCQVEEKACVYTKSRRGGSHKVFQSSPTDGTSTSSIGMTPGLDTDQGSSNTANSEPVPDNSVSPGRWHLPSPGRQQESDFISLFYEYFYPGTPFILPQDYLVLRQKSDPSSLEHLLPVVEYIGSKYDPGVDSERYEEFADTVLNSANLPANGFSVQALILFAVAKHCSDKDDLAEILIDKAISLASSIGMDDRNFAGEHGEGVAVLEESWRRTWWALYMTTVTFAVIGHRLTHRLQENVQWNVGLPCENWDYENGRIPVPYTIEEYDNREFVEEEIVFSSMTYLIDAIRISSSNIATKIAPFSPGSRTVAAADAKFVNWFLYLPDCKREAVREDGKVDETMFLAHIFVNIEKILVHRPHSALVFSDIEARSKCTPPADQRQSRDLQRSVLLHTAKALEATSTTIMMFALPTPMLKHSPLVVCALSLAVMSQVSACNHVLNPSGKMSMGDNTERRAEAYEIGRDRVRLGLGALKAAARVWGMARRSVREVVGVSRELLTGDRRKPPPGSEGSRDSMSEALS